ncbi:MAG: DUF433 domain-containing protein [Planctomycetes bacterium]|nr:DUF433 domain-containing protein [Planctomycetota bacterium]
MSTATRYRWITRHPGIVGGEPIIRGTRVPVRALIGCYKLGMDFEEILEGYLLTPAQLHEAFAYYYDHQEEIEELLRPIEPEELAAKYGFTLTPEGFFIKDKGAAPEQARGAATGAGRRRPRRRSQSAAPARV